MTALVSVLFIIVVFSLQIRRVQDGKISKKKAIVLYVGYTFTPLILYSLVFMSLVGIEELTHSAIIGEGYARTLPFVIVVGAAIVIITTLVLSIVMLFVNRKN